MNTLINRLMMRVHRTERGASLVEYGLLVVAILVAAAAVAKELPKL